MIDFTFFGSSRLSVIVLDELLKFDLKPSLVVTTPDKPQGRKLEIKPNVVKSWAIEHNVKVIDDLQKIPRENANLFIVASYGKIIPKEIIELPKHKTLNIHPSLLPEYRGASPLPTAILNDTKNTGVTIMQLDTEMDHGPIVIQKRIEIMKWPTYEEFEEMMAIVGAHLLAETLPKWVDGKIVPTEQNHAKATYTKKIKKEDGLVDLSVDDPYLIFRKVQAFHEWPQAYFFVKKEDHSTGEHRKIRVKITSASFEDNTLTINTVIPEGKKEMSYKDFERGYLK